MRSTILVWVTEGVRKGRAAVRGGGQHTRPTLTFDPAAFSLSASAVVKTMLANCQPEAKVTGGGSAWSARAGYPYSIAQTHSTPTPMSVRHVRIHVHASHGI